MTYQKCADCVGRFNPCAKCVERFEKLRRFNEKVKGAR